ncbi:MAG: hypothetical protein CAK89_06280 [Opitutia bacterium AMD-G3]|nr:MAG: hypothetical protein CAK89_06280 [Opitutae bacterium AMD-G3]
MRRTLLHLLFLATVPLVAAVDFDHEIVPLLRKHCGECHTGDKRKGGFSMNTRVSLLEGSENGPVVVPSDVAQSKLLELVASADLDVRMPPEGDGLSPAEVARLKAWIAEGAVWTSGFAFKQPAYEPPLKPRTPVLPAAQDGREHPIDRVLDAWVKARQLPRPIVADDATFLRRAYLDLVGVLPTATESDAFLAERAPDKRAKLVKTLLARDLDYADHWMAFWNDLLRNDYAGTGYIDGGRKQVTGWLYAALAENKPYDAFVRELIAPTPASEGFAKGIIWRGSVSAGARPELQFSQSISQTFLGINMKCASCHDSFVDRWKLRDAYGLAAITSNQPLELVRCDVPTGKTAVAAWPFPELGQVDPSKPRSERLQQLATLMTHPENGRLQRTMVNRLWHRLMGRGVVHPVDAMQTEPWNQDLLDVLANRLVESKYDLKAVLEFIATSQAYQARTETLTRTTDDKGYVYRGPRAKRLTAEQFVDALWRLTGTAPLKVDAAVARATAGQASLPWQAQPLWSNDKAKGALPPVGETRVFRLRFRVAEAVVKAGCVVSCDNSYELFVNGQTASKGDDWQTPQAFDLTSYLRPGENEFLLVGRNGGNAPNAAAIWLQAFLRDGKGKDTTIATGRSWEWTAAVPNAKGVLPANATWRPVAVLADRGWAKGEAKMAELLAQMSGKGSPPARASLVKSDLLQRSLGRPNREQIVSMRPNELSTLEAIDLANGQAFADLLGRGAANLLRRPWKSPDDFTQWLYVSALCRPPSAAELKVAQEVLGPRLTEQGVADLLWAVCMLPEFQTIR